MLQKIKARKPEWFSVFHWPVVPQAVINKFGGFNGLDAWLKKGAVARNEGSDIIFFEGERQLGGFDNEDGTDGYVLYPLSNNRIGLLVWCHHGFSLPGARRAEISVGGGLLEEMPEDMKVVQGIPKRVIHEMPVKPRAKSLGVDVGYESFFRVWWGPAVAARIGNDELELNPEGHTLRVDGRFTVPDLSDFPEYQFFRQRTGPINQVILEAFPRGRKLGVEKYSLAWLAL